MTDCEDQHITHARNALLKIGRGTTKDEAFEHASEALHAMRQFNGGAREALEAALQWLDTPHDPNIPAAIEAMRELKAITGDERTPDKPFARPEVPEENIA